jgi:lipopolysaccharide/colanic/teichoic acid biosynthesis glycosyltransferase
MKRLLDIIIASIALILLSPLYALVAYKVKKSGLSDLVSPGASRFTWQAL